MPRYPPAALVRLALLELTGAELAPPPTPVATLSSANVRHPAAVQATTTVPIRA